MLGFSYAVATEHLRSKSQRIFLHSPAVWSHKHRMKRESFLCPGYYRSGKPPGGWKPNCQGMQILSVVADLSAAVSDLNESFTLPKHIKRLSRSYCQKERLSGRVNNGHFDPFDLHN